MFLNCCGDCLCYPLVPFINIEANFKYVYLGAILLTISGSFAYKQVSSLPFYPELLKLVQNIVIKENSGLDALNLCHTIIYDRFDGVEVTEEEMNYLQGIKRINRDCVFMMDLLIWKMIEYQIYNNLSVRKIRGYGEEEAECCWTSD